MKQNLFRKVKRYAAIVMTFVMVIGMCSQPVFAAREAPGREIAVVYDDSGSMVKSGNTFSMNWCRAKYAMEAFAAMMKAKDRMSVFRMSQYEESELGATEPVLLTGTMAADKRVSIIHNMEDVCSNTYFNSVKAASNMLAAASSEREKWLIVLTDGDFNHYTIDQVENYIKQSARQNGFRVVYFVIGNKANSIQADEQNGVYGYRAQDSQMILQTVIKIANLVFKQQVLPEEYLRASKDGLEITLDVPVSELIVFAQGKDIQIGKLSGQKDTWPCDAMTNVKYCETLPGGDNYRNEANKVQYDRSLEGVLATYKPVELIATGTYTLPVSDISNVQIYYTPSVEIVLQMKGSKGNTYTLGTNTVSVPSDQYTVTSRLVDPLTSEPIASDLVQMQNCSIHIDNNGDLYTFERAEQEAIDIYLNAGAVTGYASADLNEYQDVFSEFSCKVDVVQRMAQVTAELPKYNGTEASSKFNFGLERLSDGTGILVSVKELRESTGEMLPLSKESWMDTEFEICIEQTKEYWESGLFEKMLYRLYEQFWGKEKSEIEWSVEKGATVSTFVVKPSVQGEAADAFYGAVDLAFQVVCPSDNHVSRGSGNCTVYIAPMPLSFILPNLLMLFGAFVLLILILILFVRKKRLPEGLYATLSIETTMLGGFAGERPDAVRLNIKRHFTLFFPERATVTTTISNKLSASSLELVAMTPGIGKKKRAFMITNLDKLETTSIAPVEVDGQPIADRLAKGKKRGYSSRTKITCVANQYIPPRGGKARCTIQFGQEHKAGIKNILTLLKTRKGTPDTKQKHKRRRKK